MTRITHLVMDDLVPSNFSMYHTSDAILGHISVLVEICRSSLICMIISTCEIHTETMTCFLFYDDSLMESFLSHLVKLILSYIVVIL